LRHLSDEDLLKQIARLGGLDAEVAASADMLEFILPSLRADIALFETYDAAGLIPLNLPLVAVWGAHDPSVDGETVAQWAAYTTNEFNLERAEAGHFVLVADPSAAAAHVRRLLNKGSQ
jgi:surfactin synthase thioesterase subunit